MDRVAVDLADVEVVLDLGDAVRDDAVGDAPDRVWGGAVVRVGQGLPVGARDKGDDAAWRGGGAAVVFAVWGAREGGEEVVSGWL